MNIVNKILDDNQYFKEKQFKNQIVIHHTAGGGNAANVIHGWNFNQERIGVAFVIDGKGVVYKAFEPEYWAYHLGLKHGSNLSLNKASIGVEICNWGQLIEKDGKFYNYINKQVPSNEVIKIPRFRGFEYYHAYNDFQLNSLKELLKDLCTKFSINKEYRDEIWDIDHKALTGVNGIYTHVSYRSDKNDCSPQPNLINLLKTM